MKILAVAALLCLLGSNLHAQTKTAHRPSQVPPIADSRPKDTPFAIVNRDANSRAIQRTIWEKLPSGDWVPHLRGYTEVQTGMHYRGGPNGEWTESREEITLAPGGGFQATQGQHQLYLPQNIYDGVIDLTEPSGEHLKSRPMGISYFDGTNSVLISELTNSFGAIISSNQVLYPSAFTGGGFDSDLLLTYRKSGVEADLILRSQPARPETFSPNLKSEHCRIELLTEFFDVADPEQTPSTAGTADGLTDSMLGFGSMTMIAGRAFGINAGNSAADGSVAHATEPTNAIAVSKNWIRLQDPQVAGRTFLIEAVPVLKIRPQLERLPVRPGQPVRVTSADDVLYKVSATRLLPPSRIASRNRNDAPMAQSKSPQDIHSARSNFDNKPGFVLDYDIVDSGSNVLFKGDDTYYVSGSLNLSGTTVIEEGAVIKLNTNYTCSLNILGTVQCQTGPYRPAILTSADDDSIGQPIGAIPPYCTGPVTFVVINQFSED